MPIERPHPIHGHRADVLSDGTFVYIGLSSLSLFGLVHPFCSRSRVILDATMFVIPKQPIHHAMHQ